jgi:hypothetical protein
MFRTLLICAVVSASAVGCSGTPQPRPDTQAAAAARPCSPTQVSASRLPAKPYECSATPGRSYSQTDLQRTGQTNVADALPLLDPSITVHH